MQLQKVLEASKGDTQHYKKKVDTLKEEAAKLEASLEEQVVVHDKLAKAKLEIKLMIRKIEGACL